VSNKSIGTHAACRASRPGLYSLEGDDESRSLAGSFTINHSMDCTWILTLMGQAHRQYGRTMLPHLLANWKVHLPEEKATQVREARLYVSKTGLYLQQSSERV
jgi:hypothetical protein